MENSCLPTGWRAPCSASARDIISGLPQLALTVQHELRPALIDDLKLCIHLF